jgi:hypothetical protein
MRGFYLAVTAPKSCNRTPETASCPGQRFAAEIISHAIASP